jgi:hypothetical protein
MDNTKLNATHAGIMNNLNVPEPGSPEFQLYMTKLQAKTAAFDSLVMALNEAGFDTSNMSYDTLQIS